ncbi:hypothetical protein KUV28_21800, partial [Ferrimonas balearica]|nr:hypothetical protein [Ferrimonas balearica]
RGDTLSNHDWFPMYGHRFLGSSFVRKAVMQRRRADIGTATRLNKAQFKQAKREGRDDVFMYAGTANPKGTWQEFGTPHHAAQPHARPAWDQTQQQIFEQIRDDMSVEVEKAAARARRKAARQAR